MMINSRKYSVTEKRHAELAADLLVSTAHSLVRCGDLNLNGKSAEQIFIELLKHWKSAVKRNANAEFTIDYTESLLREASKYAGKKDNLLSCVFLATWAEHFLNQLVESVLSRDKRFRSFAGILVRDMSLRAKFIWVHIQLETTISEKNLRRLIDVSEIRNYFIHYKWQTEDPKQKDRQAKVRRHGMLLVKHLKKLDDQHIYGNARPELLKLREGLRQIALENNFYGRIVERAKSERQKSNPAS